MTGQPGQGSAVEEDPDSGLVTAFLERVKVEPVRNSRIVDVRFEAKDPVLAAQISNEIVKSYIDQKLETKLNRCQGCGKMAERADR